MGIKMIDELRKTGCLNIVIFFILSSMFCVCISIVRYAATDKTTFLSLNWNLFLAFVPWFISMILIMDKQTNKVVLAILVLTWVIFFPNSPYILTDLFHLTPRRFPPIWYDFVLVLSYAWTGLMFGFVSLINIETILIRHLNKRIVDVISTILLFMASFGIYLGRYLRWNSWDIISNPLDIFADILEIFSRPFDYQRAWGVTILMGLMLNMMYLSIKLLNVKK
jgi:uncharacterized membrane protein